MQVVLNERVYCMALDQIDMTSNLDITAGLEEMIFTVIGISQSSHHIRISDGEITLGTDDLYPLLIDKPKDANESDEALLKIKAEYREDAPLKISYF